MLIGAPPYGSVDAQGNAIGYDADVTALVGKYLGVPVEIVEVEGYDLVGAVAAG